MELLSEVIELAKQVREYGADAFGPWAPTVTTIGQTMAAGIAILAIFAGKSFWAPPTPTLSNYPVRISGIVAMVGVAALFVWSKNGGTAYNFLTTAVIAIVVGILGSITYLGFRQLLCFRCQNDRELYIRGFRLDRLARRVLDLRLLPADQLCDANNALPQQRKLAANENGLITVPQSASSYFCRSGKEADFIWTLGSLVMAQVLLFVIYLFVMVPLTVAIAGVSVAVSQPELKEKQAGKEHIIELPADVLFDFGKADFRPGAIQSLQQAAKILRDYGVHAVRIEGHADSQGSDNINFPLSRQRAEAVQDWLEHHGDLQNMHFIVVGYGSTRPLEPNTKPDGSDNPEGREQNRRVSIIFDKPN
jgi:outer membrane protein OmpA-like peptidoglycan-associated protein